MINKTMQYTTDVKCIFQQLENFDPITTMTLIAKLLQTSTAVFQKDVLS